MGGDKAFMERRGRRIIKRGNAMTGKLKRSQLSGPIRRYMKRQETSLNRICRSIWTFTNRLGESYIFASYTTGNFPVDRDRIVVTLGYWDKRITKWVPPL